MCLISYKPESQKAAKDLIVYKIVKPVGGENKVTSVYYNFVYELGQLYFKNDFGNPRPLWNIENDVYTWEGQGFHSYLHLRYARETLRRFGMTEVVLVECIIPKGALTATDMDKQGIVSSSIIITKLLKADGMCMQMNKIDCYQMAMDYFIPVSIVEDLARQNEFNECKTRAAVEEYICDMENYYEGFGAYCNDDGFRS